MKKVIKFSALFLPFVIMSVAIIASGLIGLSVRGINLGIDFQAGFIEKIRIAPTAFTLSYQGSQSVTVNQGNNGIDFVMTGVGGSDNQTVSFPYATYADLGSFAAAAAAVPGVTVNVIAPASTPLKGMFTDSETSSRLSGVPYAFHYVPADAETISSDEIRAVLAVYPNAAVQVLGKSSDRAFQIRIKDDGSDANASITIRTALKKAFDTAYGSANYAVIGNDFVGARLSQSLAGNTVWLVLATLALIWVYATIRFRWDFACGAVLAVMHDALIMITFIVWTQMQFNSITIAAILTIIGYSINDTIVVYDRIREIMKIRPDLNITDALNTAQSEILGRTIITTVTTMLAVLSLFVFTSGDMKDFALALMVGMISGAYSTIYIASAFINFISRFRKDKGMLRDRAPKLSTSGELV